MMLGFHKFPNPDNFQNLQVRLGSVSAAFKYSPSISGTCLLPHRVTYRVPVVRIESDDRLHQINVLLYEKLIHGDEMLES